MKRLLTFSALLLFANLYAQQLYVPTVPHHTPFETKLQLQPTTILQLQYSIFDSLVNAYSYFSMRQQPLWYDPSADFLVTIKRGALNGNEIFYRFSGDRGENWSEPIGPIQLSSADVPRYPSIVSTILTDGGFSDTIFVYFFPIVLNQSWGSVQTGIAIGSVFSTEQLNGIEGDNGQLYPISTASKLRIFNDGESALIVTQLFPPEGASTAENNALGAILVDIANEEITGFIPPQWASTVFVDPGNPGSRTSTIVNVDIGPDGTLYFGAFGVFANTTAPAPGVSKSTDGGLTWSEFDVFPLPLLEDYAIEHQANPDSVFLSFAPKDFTVTGEGEFSFIVQCFESNADKVQSGEPELRHLVEIGKANGEWYIRKIADISGFVIRYTDTDINQTGSEVQVARTPDGSVIMAKWLEFVTFIANQDIDGDGSSPDTVLSTDVFVAFRNTNSEQWSDPIDVTQSLLLDRITHIAPLLPADLQNIPLLNVVSVPNDDETTAAEQLISAQRTLLRKQWVTITHFSLAATGIADRNLSPTNSQLRAKIRPDQKLWLAFQVPQPMPVTIDLFAISGQHIAQIFSGSANQYQTLTYDVSSLATGAYVVRLRAGDQVLTKVVMKY